VYRTMVRAKVSAIGKNAAKVKLHMDLALRYISHDQSPLLVVMNGVSGSGKSFVAARLVGPLRAICIRSDVVRKRMWNLAPLERSGSAVDAGMYSAEATERVYERVASLARIMLLQGLSVIVDATNTKLKAREDFRKLASEAKARFVLVACFASQEVLIERVRERRLVGKDPSESTEQVLIAQQQRAERPDASEGAIFLDTTKGLTVDDVLKFAEKIVPPQSN
jgi:uncharacterized protein